MIHRLSDIDASEWQGENELWLDPLGDSVAKSSCSLTVAGQTVSYRWEHDGKKHEGSLSVTADGAGFTDTFHSDTTMKCVRIDGARGILQVEGTYGPDKDWGWRIALVYRAPLEQLVLQMTNIAPWGEEARAVRATLSKR